MTDSAVADHLTRLKLKLLEKKLENEQETMEDCESPVPETRNYGAHNYALRSALRRRKDLLQQLREQNLWEEFSQPHGSPRMQRQHYRREPEYGHQAPPPAPLPPLPLPPPPPPPPPPPRIIQQTLPQQPATIIQQIPQHPPLITQIPSPQAFPPAPRSGSIKEDMVEMMLMQNAQMHQIIMQNMMLKSLPPPPPPPPPPAYSPANGPTAPLLHHGQLLTAPLVVRMEKTRPSAVHHHHYTPAGLPAMPPQLGFPAWPSVIPPGLGSPMGGFPSDSYHLPIPTTATHTVPAHGLFGLPPGL